MALEIAGSPRSSLCTHAGNGIHNPHKTTSVEVLEGAEYCVTCVLRLHTCPDERHSNIVRVNSWHWVPGPGAALGNDRADGVINVLRRVWDRVERSWTQTTHTMSILPREHSDTGSSMRIVYTVVPHDCLRTTHKIERHLLEVMFCAGHLFRGAEPVLVATTTNMSPGECHPQSADTGACGLRGG